MEHRKKNSKQLLFLEGINKDTDEEKLINRLITKLEQLGFNIIGKEDEKKRVTIMEYREDELGALFEVLWTDQDMIQCF